MSFVTQEALNPRARLLSKDLTTQPAFTPRRLARQHAASRAPSRDLRTLRARRHLGVLRASARLIVTVALRQGLPGRPLD